MKKIYTTIVLLFGSIIYSQDGTLDATFGIEGIMNITNICKIKCAKIQPDGKIVGAGYIYNDSGNQACIFRLNSDFTFDTTFDTDGKLIFNYFGQFDNVLSIYVYPNGKILAGLDYGKLLRLNQDGTYDSTFGINGFVNNSGYYIAIQKDGKIISTAVYTNGYFKVFRHDIDGTLDLTFNGIGSNNILINATSCRVKDIAIQNNGQIIIIGYGPTLPSIPNMAAIRINTNGTIDNTFSLPIVAGIKVPEKIYLNNNSTFILGLNYNSPRNVALIKYDSSNALDNTFDNDGYSLISYGDPINEVNRPSMLNFQPDGKIIMTEKRAYTLNSNVYYDGIISRQNTDGSLDTTFGTNGYSSLYLWSSEYEPCLSLISPIDGKLIVLGTYLTYEASPGTGLSKTIRIAKYNTGIDASQLNNENHLFNSFNLSPNPTNSILSIETQEKITSISLINILGKKTNISNFENNKIDVSALQNGVYFIEIATEKGLQTQKFIKN